MALSIDICSLLFDRFIWSFLKVNRLIFCSLLKIKLLALDTANNISSKALSVLALPLIILMILVFCFSLILSWLFNSLSCNLSDWISEFISLIWELFKDNWISKSFKFDNWVKLSSWANILPFLTYPPDLKSLEILKTSPNIGNFKFACLDDETEPNAIFSGL